MKKEKQLEFNIKGISNKEELDKANKEIENDARIKLNKLLLNIIYKGKFTKKEFKDIVSLSKWIKE